VTAITFWRNRKNFAVTRATWRLTPMHYAYARRALDRIADRVRRVPPKGAWLWKLKPGVCD
jgi:hypothetical protein